MYVFVLHLVLFVGKDIALSGLSNFIMALRNVILFCLKNPFWLKMWCRANSARSAYKENLTSAKIWKRKTVCIYCWKVKQDSGRIKCKTLKHHSKRINCRCHILEDKKKYVSPRTIRGCSLGRTVPQNHILKSHSVDSYHWITITYRTLLNRESIYSNTKS